MKISEMSDSELAKMAVELDSVIFKSECFGTKDLRLFSACTAELKARNINERKARKLAKEVSNA